MARTYCLLVLNVLLIGCASEAQRYTWNTGHAEILKSVRLPHSEVDQIIRLVSSESIFPILVISRQGDDIVVYTDLEHGPQRFMVYRLKKQREGWHIVSAGEGSTIVSEEP